MSTAQKRFWGIAFAFILLVLWQLASVLIGKAYILPSPAAVIEHIWVNRVELFTVHLPITLQVVVIGAVLAILIGLIFALAMDASKKIERAVYPILTVSQTIPTMCIAPVFVLWLGYSVEMRVFVVVLINFFSVAVNVFDGLKSTPESKRELLRTFGAGRLQRLVYLRLPTALPNFFTALKITVPWSVVGAAVAEWLGAPGGLGTYSRNCMTQLDAAGLLAPLVILTVIALVLNGIIQILEKKFVTWKGEA